MRLLHAEIKAAMMPKVSGDTESMCSAGWGRMSGQKTFRNERLTYKLNIVADQAIAANDQIFLRETGCSIRELRVLRLIDDTPGTSFRDIARVTGFERSLTSRLIQSLIGAGLIERRNAPDDARVFELHTTQKGQEVRRIARGVSDLLEAILTEPLSRPELDALNAVLERLAAWVSSDEYRDRLSEE
ncbi:MarR family winged helix-turn-helix transcriptional regulator [Roseicyclus amphidinii]|uniref:MarR family winged helix-turn-helix transcriptional regulator n=1 Tax=Roseicyclus amphidinii TaxID=3034232 RepID=UPI0024E0CA7F|nr:MarR family winged helix-turn-helix transcriptional regulator [Roseicyclus sp. Amp-Y-6]